MTNHKRLAGLGRARALAIVEEQQAQKNIGTAKANSVGFLSNTLKKVEFEIKR